MSAKQQLLDLITSLNKAADGQDTSSVLCILEALKQEKMTMAVLRETRCGKLASRLKKRPNKAVSQLADELLETWKAVAKLYKAKQKASKRDSAKASKSKSTKSGDSKSQTSSKPISKSESESTDSSKSQLKASVSAKDCASALQNDFEALEAATDWRTGVRMRDFVRGKLMSALRSHWQPPVVATATDYSHFESHVELACAIESALNDAHRSENQGYKDQFKDLDYNLRRKNNDLAVRIISGEHSPQQLATMTNSQLASMKMIEKRAEENDYNFKAMKGTIKQTAMTDLYFCERCKERKCTFYMMQTRSADEPMTTFITCTVCGNRWRD